MNDGDRTTLSEYERRVLAGIEAEFARAEADSRKGRGPAAPGTLVMPLVLVLAGLAVTLVSFTRWVWVAAVGVTVAAAGLGLLFTTLARRLEEQVTPRL